MTNCKATGTAASPRVIAARLLEIAEEIGMPTNVIDLVDLRNATEIQKAVCEMNFQGLLDF